MAAKGTTFLLLLTLACRHDPQPTPGSFPQPLSPDERKAVAVAEAFVRDACYTTLPCNNTAMKAEFMEDDLRPEVIAKMRYNELSPAAYGISVGTREGVEPGWTIFFEYTDEWLRALPMSPKERSATGLRGLYVSRSHRALFMEHMDLRRDAVDTLTHRLSATP